MRNYIHVEKQRTGFQSNGQHNHGRYYCDDSLNERYVLPDNGIRHFFGKPQKIQSIRGAVPYIFIGRREERRLEESKNDIRVGTVYSI
jgi:hypothetical protein